MSKLLDDLKLSEARKSEQDELINTYFSSAPPKEKAEEKPPADKPGIPYMILLASTVILPVLFIILVLFSSKIIVDVRVIQDRGRSGSGLPEIEGERLQGNMIFYGNAEDSSKWTKHYILLALKGGYDKAFAGIEFPELKNLSNGNLTFYAKTNSSLCAMSIILKDRANAICRSSENLLTPQWQQFIIPVGRAGKVVDTSRIAHLDFEISSQHGRSDEVLIRDVIFKSSTAKR
ncbi:MAG: hypothetical protein ABH825_02840 [Candidatus Omnitrophota bacterium]